MRGFYLACYDIRDDKRLYRVHKKMMGFGDPLQYSVFICRLTKKEKLVMVEEIREIMDEGEDSFVLVFLGPDNREARERFEFYGVRSSFDDDPPLVI
jgi:CRISPR-associated protein Cas2